jgi:hypothetical protein
MDAPPPKPKSKESPEGLAEVERALSVLHGRHPEHERMRREDEEWRSKRSAQLEAVARVESRRVRSRRALYVMLGVGVVAVATVAGMHVRSELARRGRIEHLADVYRAPSATNLPPGTLNPASAAASIATLGFSLVESSGRSEPSKIEASVPAGCLLAATTVPSRIRIAHAGGAVEGPGPILTCLCEGGHVAVTADVKPGDGIVLLHAEANALGGSRAFAFLPFKPATVGQTDQACAEASLDAWIDGKRWPASGDEKGPPHPAPVVDAAASERWMSADPKRVALHGAGFKVAAIVKGDAPFGVVDVPAGSCVLLVNERATDVAGLRLKGGSMALGPTAGNSGWCTSTPALVVAQHAGEVSAKGSEGAREGAGTLREAPETMDQSAASAGALAVLFAPALRVGGLFGLRESVTRAGLALSAVSIAASDQAWSAKQLLLTSAIPETLITTANAPDFGADADARVVALSLDKPGSLVADAPADVFSYCEPPLDAATATVCVFSGPQKWRVDGAEVVAGLARAKLPFWLFALQGVSEPVALKLETQLITLARRLRRDGFEPTTIEAITELDKGAEVLGRANEDAMVVVALAPSEPWVFPYTDGPAWTIDGEPRVVPIKPLQRVTVTSTAKNLPPKATRRTVVFRRQQKK